MTDPRRIAVISGGLSQPSATRMLADRLAEATVRAFEEHGEPAVAHTVELRDHARDITNNLLTGFPSPALAAEIEQVVEADGVILVSPIFSASYSGLVKSFIDILDPTSLVDMPVLLGATGGSERHSLAIDYAMRPLFTYLRAAPLSTGVFAASSDWGNESVGHAARSTDAATGLHERIKRAGTELAAAVRDSRRAPVDPFALPSGFSPVGAYGETR